MKSSARSNSRLAGRIQNCSTAAFFRAMDAARADIEPEAHPRRGARGHDDTECVVAGIGVGVRVNLRASLRGRGIPCEGGLGGERAGRQQEEWQQEAKQVAKRPADIRVV